MTHVALKTADFTSRLEQGWTPNAWPFGDLPDINEFLSNGPEPNQHPAKFVIGRALGFEGSNYLIKGRQRSDLSILIDNKLPSDAWQSLIGVELALGMEGAPGSAKMNVLGIMGIESPLYPPIVGHDKLPDRTEGYVQGTVLEAHLDSDNSTHTLQIQAGEDTPPTTLHYPFRTLFTTGINRGDGARTVDCDGIIGQDIRVRVGVPEGAPEDSSSPHFIANMLIRTLGPTPPTN